MVLGSCGTVPVETALHSLISDNFIDKNCIYLFIYLLIYSKSQKHMSNGRTVKLQSTGLLS